MASLGWILGGIVFIAIGLAIWYTAFVLVPLGVIFIIVGIVTAVRGRRKPVDSEATPRSELSR